MICDHHGTHRPLRNHRRHKVKSFMQDNRPRRDPLVSIKHDCEDRTVSLSQHSYLDSILRRKSFEDLKPLSILTETRLRLLNSDSPTSATDFARKHDVPY